MNKKLFLPAIAFLTIINTQVLCEELPQKKEIGILSGSQGMLYLKYSKDADYDSLSIEREFTEISYSNINLMPVTSEIGPLMHSSGSTMKIGLSNTYFKWKANIQGDEAFVMFNNPYLGFELTLFNLKVSNLIAAISIAYEYGLLDNYHSISKGFPGSDYPKTCKGNYSLLTVPVTFGYELFNGFTLFSKSKAGSLIFDYTYSDYAYSKDKHCVINEYIWDTTYGIDFSLSKNLNMIFSFNYLNFVSKYQIGIAYAY